MGTSILLLSNFLWVYLLLFYLIPVVLLRWDKSQTWLDRFFISFIHSHLFIVIAVHVLVGLKLYETFSLIFFSIILYVVYVRFRHKGDLQWPKINFVLAIMRIAENRDGLKKWLKKQAGQLSWQFKARINSIRRRIRNHPVAAAVLLLLFAVSISIRFHHSLVHFYYGSSDPYVHLKWAKLLKANQLYVDGVYPYGYETITSALHVLFNLDPYIALRFMGPLSGSLLVVGIYYVMRKNVPREILFAVFAVFVYLISSFQFGYLWRQLSSLSMEYGAIFILPGIHFFLTYVRDRKIGPLILSLECFLLTLLIHPYAAICLALCIAVMLVFYFRSFPFRAIFKISLAFAAVGIVGAAPLGIGLLAGIPFHGSSIGFVKESVQTNSFQADSITLTYLFSNPHLFIFFVCLMIVAGYHIIKRKSEERFTETDIRPFLFISFLLVLSYKSEEIGLPSIMMAYRLEVFLPILTSVVIAFVLLVVTKWRWRRFWQCSLITAICLFFFLTTDNYQVPKGDRYQYDEAVEAYLKIKKELPLQNWTIISTIEEYPLSIEYGWHYNLADLVLELASGKKLSFPTDDVFIFIETVPIGSNTPIETAGITDLSLPKVTENLDYYTIPEHRRLLETKALYWIEKVQATHKNLLTIYKKTDNMTIYRLQQDANRPYNLSQLVK